MLAQLAAKPQVIAVVDDDMAVRNSLRFSLEIDGYTVREYGDAESFLEDADSTSWDCVVVDQRLPGITGVDALLWLRDHQIGTPALLIISEPNAAAYRKAEKAGIEILEKPLWGDSLNEKIHKLLDKPHHA